MSEFTKEEKELAIWLFEQRQTCDTETWLCLARKIQEREKELLKTAYDAMNERLENTVFMIGSDPNSVSLSTFQIYTDIIKSHFFTSPKGSKESVDASVATEEESTKVMITEQRTSKDIVNSGASVATSFEERHPGLKGKQFFVDEFSPGEVQERELFTSKGIITKKLAPEPHNYSVKSFELSKDGRLYDEQLIDETQLDKAVVREAIKELRARLWNDDDEMYAEELVDEELTELLKRLGL